MNMFNEKNQQFGTKRAPEESECALLCRRRKSASFGSCRSLRVVLLRLAVGTLKLKDGRSSYRRCSVLLSTSRRLHARSSAVALDSVHLRVCVACACACVRAYVRTCAWRVCRNKLKVEAIDKVKLPDSLTNSCQPGIDTQRTLDKNFNFPLYAAAAFQCFSAPRWSQYGNKTFDCSLIKLGICVCAPLSAL